MYCSSVSVIPQIATLDKMPSANEKIYNTGTGSRMVRDGNRGGGGKGFGDDLGRRGAEPSLFL